MTKYIGSVLVLVTAAFGTGCTIQDVARPPLAGPSEMSLSLVLTANPDVLSLDGASQTQITVEARDTNGQLAPNVPLRVQILADGEVTDFGTISARTLVTGSNGRATFTYTAPSFISGAIPKLQLSVTPTGTDASAHIDRVVTVRLVPPGSIGTSPTARFTFVPTAPAAFTDVRFDGSTSTAGLGAVITSYVWDYGDNTSGTGITATHQFGAVGNYLVRLTVTDNNGRSNQSAAQILTVGAGTSPTATFVFSPTAPVSGQTVFFNAAQSTAGAGHRIVNHRWNWGDGAPDTGGGTASHVFTIPGTYVVVLTVTDEAGQVGTTSVEVTIT
ncbi:MAG: PKD domain-containing protein [Vicinamibacterales bacterium]